MHEMSKVIGISGPADGNSSFLIEVELDTAEEGGVKAERRQMTFFIILVIG